MKETLEPGKSQPPDPNCGTANEPTKDNDSNKSVPKKLTKSERRVLQEEQRAAKLDRLSKGLPAKIKAPKTNQTKTNQTKVNLTKTNQTETNQQKTNQAKAKTTESSRNDKNSIKDKPTQIDSTNIDNADQNVQQKLKDLKIYQTINLNVSDPPINSNIEDETIPDSNTPRNVSSTTATDDQTQGERAIRSRNHMDDPRFNKRMTKKLSKQNIPIRVETTRKMVIFSHLKQYDKPYIIEQNFNRLSESIGYDFIVLGLQYSDGILIGSNARSIALLIALRNFVINYKTPSDKVLSRDMEVSLRPKINFLNQCRPMAIGMGNIIKYLKFNITSLPYTLTEEESKAELLQKLEQFYQSRIINAHNTIVNVTQAKINDKDVILTYGCSSLISDILVEAINRKKNIKLIIVDSKPRFEGRKMLDKFSKIGIDCTYTGINGTSYVMKKVTKVLLGAHGLLANGAVITRVGSAMVTTVANAFNVPVLVCCESYKFSERAQTDAIVYNELCDPHELITSTPNAPYSFENWKNANTVCMLNLSYDVILPKFISALATELGVVPCTSAPIVIRMKNSYS